MLNFLFKSLRLLTLNYKFSRGNSTLLIFVFHKVSNEETKFHTPLKLDTYKNLCYFISKYYNIIHFSEVENYYSKKNSKPAAIITFDDGLIDIKKCVFPFMKKENLKFNINIDTEILSTQLPQDFLRVYDILNNTKIDSYFDPKYMNEPIQVADKNHYYVESMFTEVLSNLSRENKRDFVIRMDETLEMKKENYYGVLSEDDLTYLSENHLVEIGSHTHSHPDLQKISDFEVKEELLVSKEILEKLMNKPVDIIAYPNGKCDGKIDEIAKSVGYKFLLKSENRINKNIDYCNDNYFRVNQYHNSYEVALAYSFGVIDYLKKIKNGKLFNS